MIRLPAARRAAEAVHAGGVLRLVVTPEIIEITAKVIMTFVEGDEQAQRSEKILEENGKE